MARLTQTALGEPENDASPKSVEISQQAQIMFTFIRASTDLARELIIGATPESLRLDFKRTINGWDTPRAAPNRAEIIRNAQKELVRDITQFANTDGGCLMIGVQEARDSVTGQNVAKTIVSVTDADNMKAWIETAIRNLCVPATFSHETLSLSYGTDTVVVVNVAPSRALIYLWDTATHTIEVLRRTSHGKDWMNPDEVERHLMNGSRAARLAVIEARQLATSVEVSVAGGFRHEQTGTERMMSWRPHAPATVRAFGEASMELAVPTSSTSSLVLNIPYGIITEAWADTAGRLCLLLSMVPLVTLDSQIVLVPR